jgi:hypothetical protein
MIRSWLVVVATAVGCGDNSDVCGPGTIDQDGICTPAAPAPPCGEGTHLDDESGTCLPDPAICGATEILLDGICQDPDAALTIDVQEGPEPNGLATDDAPAGILALKQIGDPGGLVVHGCIQPTSTAADLDRYLIDVTGPTLLSVTADGLGGLDAAFFAQSADPFLATWRRFGVDFSGDTSRRELYLPKAGTYELVIADARSLVDRLHGGSTYAPAGNVDGSSCYYVTLRTEAIPAPTSLPAPAGGSGTFDRQVAFYAATIAGGITNVAETIASSQAVPALVVESAGNLVAVDSGGAAPLPLGDVVIVADFVYDDAFAPVAYTLAFH